MKLTEQQRAEVEAEGMAQVRAHERRCAADRRYSDTILFGGVSMLVEHKDDRRIPPEVAERQRLTYQQIINEEA
jgi:hypothetical protein